MNEVLKEVIDTVLGDGRSIGYYISGFLFSFLGILVSLYYSSTKRDKYSSSTPYHFSWTFLLWDNTKRIVVSLIIMYLLFRTIEIKEVWLMVGVGIVVTVLFDQLIEYIMNKSEAVCKLLGMNRKKFTKP
jgi:hypothetical protein